MYSRSWFDTFAESVPQSATDLEVEGVARLAPPGEHPALLDLGCGIGRTAGPLAARGYRVTGLDTNVDALRVARRRVPSACFVALDQKDVGRLRWTFDVVIILWNSFGFGTRSDDLTTLRGVHDVLRPGGRLLLDLYHPDWLAAHAQVGVVDPRGAIVDRWITDGRCLHRIRYPDGGLDSIAFNIYRPAEIERVLVAAGFSAERRLVWWGEGAEPGPGFARYQVAAIRRDRSG